jgi:glutathione synthase/RimK-type ligase-like ATP-grasp enzyme
VVILESAAMNRGNHNHAGNDRSPVPVPIGLPTLAKMAFDGKDLAPIWNELVRQVTAANGDAAALLDLSTIAHLQGRPEDRLALQAEAFRFSRIYRHPPAAGDAGTLRLLAFVAPGDFMANIPIEFMVRSANVSLDMIYVVPGMPLPEIPDHDVALVAVAESDENQPVLAEIAKLIRQWPRPVINKPEYIARLTRAGTWQLLNDIPGVVFPMNLRVPHQTMLALQSGTVDIENILGGAGFPIIARPADSHAGKGLVKLDSAEELPDYLDEWPVDDFYIAPFVDYRGADGLFRKYRIAFIDGRPFACHMAISEHWMIHYLNAGMTESATKRAEEAKFMTTFDDDFAIRHRIALEAIAQRAGLEYLPIDCAETRDGKLLVFESGTNMIVHSMDPPDLFPYKPPQMEKVFAAFEAMLRRAAGRHQPAPAIAPPLVPRHAETELSDLPT